MADQRTCDVCGKVLPERGYTWVGWTRHTDTGTCNSSQWKDHRREEHQTVCDEDCEVRFFLRAVLQAKAEPARKRAEDRALEAHGALVKSQEKIASLTKKQTRTKGRGR